MMFDPHELALTLRIWWLFLRSDARVVKLRGWLTRSLTRSPRIDLVTRRDALYHWLDVALFPRLLAYTTHRAHIALMLALWLALLVGGGWTAFELVGGNYTNGLSGLMTCIIALQQAHHRRENHEQHAATRDAIHERFAQHEAKLDALQAHITRRRS